MSSLNKKSILFFIRDLRVGGAEKLSLSLAKALDRERFAPAIVTLDASGALRREIPDDIPVISLHGAQGNALQFPWRCYLYARRLRTLVLQERPAVVVTANWFAGIVASLAISAIRATGAALIVEIHVPLRRFLNSSSFGNSLSLVKRWVTSHLFRRADAIVAVSSLVAEEARTLLALPAGKIRTIRNGIDVDAILSASRGESAIAISGPYFVSVGRLEPEKGHRILLQALASVSSAVPQRLVIVGDGSERRSLEQLAVSLGIDDRVIFTGMLDNPYPVMARADFLVLPSQWEAYPLVLLESLVLRLPVISTGTDGALEILDHGRYGRIIPVADPALLANEIATFSADAALRARYVRGDAVQELSLQAMVLAYQKLFEERR